MAEPTLPKGLGTVKWNDLIKGIYYAISAQLLALVYFGFEQIFTEHPHFPTWVEWLPYLRATVFAILGYIVAKLGVNNVGQILTKDKEVVQVSKGTLDNLKDRADQNLPIGARNVQNNEDKDYRT